MKTPREMLMPVKLVLTVIIAIIVPSIWFAARVDTRLEGLEMGKTAGQTHVERIAKNEGAITALNNAINRIDKNVQKIADRLYEDAHRPPGY